MYMVDLIGIMTQRTKSIHSHFFHTSVVYNRFNYSHTLNTLIQVLADMRHL